MRLIDADDYKEKIIELLEIEWGYEGIRKDVSRIIDSMPTMEERPHGEWILLKQGGVFCKNCKFTIPFRGSKPKYSFCPNCGASMISSNSEIEKLNSEKTCLNCGTSEQECELGNRARHGFCGNWTERR